MCVCVCIGMSVCEREFHVCLCACCLNTRYDSISSLCSQQIIYDLLFSAGCYPKIVPVRTISPCHCRWWCGVTFILNNEQRDAYFIDSHKSFVRARYFSSTITSVFGIFEKRRFRFFFLFFLSLSSAIWECSNWIFTQLIIIWAETRKWL